MEDIFTVSCPECDKRLKVRVELAGKRIRCRDCGNTFVAKAPAAAPKAAQPRPAAAPKPTAPRPAAAPASKRVTDEYDDANPYGVTDLDLTPRCPHCAHELESEDTVLCVGCGYNLETREHLKTVRTVETTGGDQFLWLLPGILCVLGFLFLVGLDLFWYFVFFHGQALEEVPILWMLGTGPVTLWIIIDSFFGMYYFGKFAVKRLILNPIAPEKMK
jgi:hypothetical protein